MKAYHVYRFSGSAPIQPRALELITHMYACVIHHAANPGLPLILVTDTRSKSFYDQWRITALYDDVITEIFDDYPEQRISPQYWASPKLWAMSKMRTPFAILDTDLIFHRPLSDYEVCDVLYLHRESTAIYPNVFDIEGPEGFVWDPEMARSFINSQPLNCALIGMFNEEFKSDYVQRYFDFVLDSSGVLQLAGENSHRMYSPAAAQITLEQWFLAALADHWTRVQRRPIRTRAACEVISTSVDFFGYDMDRGPMTSSDPRLDSTFFHLWGAKTTGRDTESYQRACQTLTAGRFIVENSAYRDALYEPFTRLLGMLAA